MAFTKLQPNFLIFRPVYREAVVISLIFLVFAVLWIIYSDWLALHFVSQGKLKLTFVQTVKGLAFVTGAAGIFFLALQWAFHRFHLAEKRSAQQEERYHSLLNHLPGISYCCINDEHFTMTFMNEPVEEVTGYKPAELINNAKVSYKDLIDFRDQDRVDEEIDKALKQDKEFRIYYRIKTRTNETRWVWEQGSLAFIKNGTEYLEGYIVDVTEFYEVKSELEVKDTFYQMLLENANDAIFVLDANEEYQALSKFREVNEVACERLKMDKAELLNTHPLDISIFRNIQDLGQKLHTFFKEGSIKLESSFVDFTGSIRYVEINAHLFKLGEHSTVLAISRDTTDRILARQILEEKNQELRTLLYKASHDLRSPITNVLGLVNVAREEVQEDTARQYLEMLNQSGEQLLYVVESIGSASVSKKHELEIEPVNSQSLMAHVKDYFRAVPAFRNAHWEEDIDVSQTFYSDNTLLETILSKLIHNALVYRRHEEPYLAVSIQVENHELYLRIKDDGEGIPPEIQDKVYEMFYRGNNKSSGSGLGLYIVKNAVEKLGGTIEFNSEKHQGTAFFIKLPDLKEESYFLEEKSNVELDERKN